MANSYYMSDVTNILARFIPKISDSDMASFIANIAVNEMWMRYDFRETLNVLPPFYLIPNAQDHGSPFVAVPADFLGLRQAYLVRLASSPVYRKPLTPLKDLTLTSVLGPPSSMGYVPATASFRVFPRVPQNLGAPDWMIEGEYKKQPPKVTPDALSSTFLPFADIYLMNMVEVFKWAGWQLVGDARAGGIQKQKDGSVVYTGQFAVAMEAIDAMAQNEGVELGDIAIAPQEQLAITSQNGGFGYNGRGFGW